MRLNTLRIFTNISIGSVSSQYYDSSNTEPKKILRFQKFAAILQRIIISVYFLKLLSLTIIIFSLACHSQESIYIGGNKPLAKIIDSLKVDKRKITIVIDKSDFRLYVRVDTSTLKEYPVVFGQNTIDDKLMEGDKCTPEGRFKIISKYPHNKWSKFIWINYPNEESQRKHDVAKKNRTIPADAKIGGEVGIHGVPRGMDFLIDTKTNWTLGCISLKNNDVDELYPYITAKTIIEIRK